MTRHAIHSSLSVAALLALLAGCTSAGAPQPAVTRPVQQPVAGPAGLTRGDMLLGRNAASLVALFGQPGLDVREGTARKLQFSGTHCVLDVYLYEPRAGAEQVSTHADARLPDGRDTDRTACADALRRR